MTTDWSGALAYAVLPWMLITIQLPWVNIFLQILLALFAVLIIHRIGTAILFRLAAPFPFSRRLVLYGNRPGRAALFLMMTQVILRNNLDAFGFMPMLSHFTALALIATLTWFGVRCVSAVSDTIIELHPVDNADNLQARRVQTQTKVLAKSIMVMLVLLGSGAALMTLPMLRQIGTSLLASAGVAGLVVGFAAKPVLGNLLAGLQIALTQPIRLEDVVIIENEWGWIEEITGTYVVVRIWDQRRLVIPLQWFIENPFQNWTRTSSEILGTVLLWVDYRLPLEPVRKEADRICRNAPEWDERLCLIQVVEAGTQSMQLRVLVSAADAGRSWDLRCRVREGLISYIQDRYPEFLPRTRAEISDARGNHSAAPAAHG